MHPLVYFYIFARWATSLGRSTGRVVDANNMKKAQSDWETYRQARAQQKAMREWQKHQKGK